MKAFCVRLYKNLWNKLHDFKPFQRKTSALSWSSPPLSTRICGQLFLTLYLPSYPTFTEFHFAGFPAYPSPCLFSLTYNSNVVVAFVPGSLQQVKFLFAPFLVCAARRTEHHPLIRVDLPWLREHLEIRLTCFIPASGDSEHTVQHCVKQAVSWVWVWFFSDLHFWQLDVNLFTKPTFSSLFSTLSEN